MDWRIPFAIAAVAGVGCASAGPPGQAAPVDARFGTGDAPVDPSSPDAAAPVADAPPAATCTTTATCQTATVLPGIGGDEDGAGTSSASGSQAAWFSIRLSETDSGPFADPMSMQTTLTSPSGAMFDLVVFLAADASSTECTTPSGTVSTSGTTETSTLEWGETGTFANNADDSRTVTIQVVPHAGTACSPNTTWSLAIVTGFD